MEQPPIQSLWVGDRLSKLEQLSIGSFLKLGHAYHLYVYQEPSGVPEGTTLRDASEILPRSFLFTDKTHGSLGAFSDFFRFKLLLDRGGWWVDTDIVCRRRFDFESEHVFASEQATVGPHVTSCAIKSPPGSAIVRDAWERVQALDRQNIRWAEAGPYMLAACVESNGLQGFVQAPKTFCPISPEDWESVLIPKLHREFEDETYGIHLWHELWRRAKRDKDADYPRGCLYETWKREYGLAEDPGFVGDLAQRAKSVLSRFGKGQQAK